MRVLVAIDDSQYSSAAIESVLTGNWPDDSQFRVIMVIEPLYAPYDFAGVYLLNSMIEADKEFAEHCSNLVERRIVQLKGKFGEEKVSGEVLKGPISDTIIDQAKSWNADLIVMGSHGRKGFNKFLLGSVAQSVAGQAPCSIEIVKIKDSTIVAPPQVVANSSLKD
jgi:nucleotide-binding universal stress UspA family protein